MLEFSLRQIKLLDHLLNHEDSEIDDLLSAGSISLRTFQNEIIYMNEKLQACRLNLEITTNFKKGYQIKKTAANALNFELLKRQCHRYLNHELTILYGTNPRITYIIRRFLSADKYIQSYDLKNELYISMATLTKDLKIVRSILAQYGLDLVTIPYYGMKIKGDVYQIQSAMIDFCDIYDIYEENFYIEPMAFQQYHIQSDILSDIREQLIQCLQKYQLNLKDQYFIHLYFFCLIQLSKTKQTQIKTAYNTAQTRCYRCAEEICRDMKIDDSHVHFVYLLIISGMENIGDEDIRCLNFDADPKQICEEVCLRISQNNHLNLNEHESIKKIIYQNIITLLIKKDYHILMKISQISNFESVKNAPLSCSLSMTILETIKDMVHVPYSSIDIMNLTIRIYGIIFCIQNKYKKINLAVFSLHGKYAAEAYASKLEFLNKYDIEISYFSYYEIEQIDLSQYDNIIILGSNSLYINDNRSQVIFLQYYEHVTNEVLYSKVLSRHQIKSFSVDKLENKIEIHLSNENETGIHQMAEVLQEYGCHEKNVQAILETFLHMNGQHFQFDPFIICLLWNRELAYTSFHFVFDLPLKMYGRSYHEIQVAVIDPNFNITTIKQGDSGLRRKQRRMNAKKEAVYSKEKKKQTNLNS